MCEIKIRTIDACFAYTAEYDVNGMEDFFDLETGGNILYDLMYLMEAENPDVVVPEIPYDYNFIEFPMEALPDGRKHIKYFDLCENKGTDNAEGKYRFVDVPEIEAATMMFKGPFCTADKGFDIVYAWIEENGYEISGPGRISTIHGPWDREDQLEYEIEVQVPVRKK